MPCGVGPYPAVLPLDVPHPQRGQIDRPRRCSRRPPTTASRRHAPAAAGRPRHPRVAIKLLGRGGRPRRQARRLRGRHHDHQQGDEQGEDGGQPLHLVLLPLRSRFAQVRLAHALVGGQRWRRCPTAPPGRSRARSRGWRCRAPSARSARPAGSSCPRRLISLDDLEDLLDQDRRQAHRRLVQQQQPGPRHQRPADRAHLLLAARQRAGLLGAAAPAAAGTARRRARCPARSPPGRRAGRRPSRGSRAPSCAGTAAGPRATGRCPS